MITRRSILPLLAATLGSPAALGGETAPAQGSLQEQVLRAYKKASAVALARVIQARFQSALAAPFGESPVHLARLEVIEQWKGRHATGSVLETIAPTRAGTHGVVLTPGQTYLLYLHGREPYDLSLSRRDALLAEATDDIAILRSRFGRLPAAP